MGIIGVGLFCVPIIGWIILWFMRQSRLRHEELLAAVCGPQRQGDPGLGPVRAMCKPWLNTWITALSRGLTR